MRRLDGLIIGLAILVILGGLVERRPDRAGGPPPGLGQPLRRSPIEAQPPTAGFVPGADALVREVPAPPVSRFRPGVVIDSDGQARRGGAFIGTAWALVGASAMMSARHVTDDCRRLRLLGGPALPPAAGHPNADISAIPVGGPVADGLALSRDPLVVGEDVYLVGYPSGRAAAVHGSVTGTGMLDHRMLGHRETIVVVAQRKRHPPGSAGLGGISGGPVLDAYGHVVGSVIGGSSRRARSIISTERNLAWLAATAGGATMASLGAPARAPVVTPRNFTGVVAPLLADGAVRVVRCDR